jgi:4-methylaminobutanoate oxidase (formaldehyde-forming)
MKSTDIAIVGGGLLGCALAYSLTRECDARVTLFDTNAIGSQASSRAAGLMGLARSSPVLFEMVAETYRVMGELQECLPQPPSLHRCGSLTIADTESSRAALESLFALCCQQQLPVEWLSAQQARRLAPWLSIAESSLVLYVADDGYADGYCMTNAYLQAAVQQGALVRKGCRVRSLVHSATAIEGVMTEEGLCGAAVVIVAAGVWSGLLLSPLGIMLPMAPVRSQYWITAPHPHFSALQPFVLLPDARGYARTEVGSLLFGVRERNSFVADAAELPHDLNSYVVGGDRDGMATLEQELEPLLTYYPPLGDMPLAHYISGFSTYTPDSRFVLGAIDTVGGLYVASGCCGGGLAASGGIGKAVMEAVLGRACSWDMRQFAWDRFGPIDSAQPDFAQRCGMARSQKISG